MNNFIFSLLLVLLFAPHVQAGPRVNNGGGAWVCVNKETQKTEWIELLDLASDIGKSYSNTAQNEWTLYREKLDLIKSQIPELQKILMSAPIDLQRRIKFVDHALDIIADAAMSNKPLPSTCNSGHVQYVQVADFLITGDLVIDKEVWQSKKFSMHSKAALLLHERLYYAFRTLLKDETSLRAQKIVEILFQDSFNEKSIQDINKNLKIDQNFWGWLSERTVVLSPVELTCSIALLHGGTRLLFKFKYFRHVQYGSRLVGKLRDYSFIVETDPEDGAPRVMKLTHDPSGVSAIRNGDDIVTVFFRSRSVSVELANSVQKVDAELRCQNEFQTIQIRRPDFSGE